MGKPIRTMKVKSPSLKGYVRRPVVKVRIRIKGRVFNTEANIQDRSHMKFPVIIGRNLLTGNYLVDPEIRKEAVARGDKVRIFSPGPFTIKQNGTEYIEGPHCPEPHRWYATVNVVDGVITKVT